MGAGEDFGEIDSDELVFTFKPNTDISCRVKLINTSNNHVAYKVKTSRQYRVRPNVCIVKPRSTCEVIVTRKAQDVMPLPCVIAKEKFMFERAVVSHETPVNDINTLFKSEEWESRINKRKLMVVVKSQEVMSMKARMEEFLLWVKEDQRLRVQELELFVKEEEKLISEEW